MRRLAAAYGGAWPEIAAHITDPAKVNYTWFDRLLVEGSWHRGRVVLIGDAAHCCPPTLAQGAALSLEDAWRPRRPAHRRTTRCSRRLRAPHPGATVVELGSGSSTAYATPTCPA